MANQDLRAQLQENIDEAEWDWLIPHAKRDAIIIVTAGLDLVEVGVALASDNTTQVELWISEALIAKPSAEQMGEWNSDRTRRFDSLIVQPYVLVQEKVGA